jgi:hypothetical protein
MARVIQIAGRPLSTPNATSTATPPVASTKTNSDNSAQSNATGQAAPKPVGWPRTASWNAPSPHRQHRTSATNVNPAPTMKRIHTRRPDMVLCLAEAPHDHVRTPRL